MVNANKGGIGQLNSGFASRPMISVVDVDDDDEPEEIDDFDVSVNYLPIEVEVEDIVEETLAQRDPPSSDHEPVNMSNKSSAL